MKRILARLIVLTVCMSLLFTYTMPISFSYATDYTGKDIKKSATTENIKLGKGAYIIVVGKTELLDVIQPFMDFKTRQNFIVEVETVKDIKKNYQGVDLAEQIRNYLKDKITDNSPTYTLLIGAPYINRDNKTSISTGGDIPMRYVYPHYDEPNNYIEDHHPTDFYYCDLKGDWDKNGDNHYGDTFDDEIVEATNNYIGRIPSSDPVAVEKILDSIVSIEKEIKEEGLNYSALLAMYHSGGNDDPKHDSAFWGEEVRKEILEPNGFNVATLYEKEGDSPSTYDCIAPLNDSNLKQHFSNNDIIVTNGHGGVTRTIWHDINENGRVDEDELSYSTFFTTDILQYLSESGYRTKIFYDWGCNTFNIYGDHSSSVTANSILSSGLAGAVVATTRSVGFPLDLPQFFETVVKNKKTVGEYLYDSAIAKDKWGRNRNYITETCILGDPSLGLFPLSPQIPSVPKNLTTTVSNKTITLNWPSSTQGTYPIAGYAIYKGTTSGGESSVPIGTVNASTTTYTDKNVTLGITYYYYVKAFDNQSPANYSESSNEVSALCKKLVQEIIIKLWPDNPMMTVNGSLQEIDPGRGTKPVIITEWSRTVVPIRAIVEALGGTIGWGGTERKVTINFKGTVIELWIDSSKARVNSNAVYIDPDNHGVKPIIVNSRTMLPLRFVAESLGCDVGWDNDTRTITITYGG
ncbi:MAG: hypothetical protein J7J57_04200 [Caldisericaceae bacterium]|nr:hypothetical protein [Caldisericaceae bacterium]